MPNSPRRNEYSTLSLESGSFARDHVAIHLFATLLRSDKEFSRNAVADGSGTANPISPRIMVLPSICMDAKRCPHWQGKAPSFAVLDSVPGHCDSRICRTFRSTVGHRYLVASRLKCAIDSLQGEVQASDFGLLEFWHLDKAARGTRQRPGFDRLLCFAVRKRRKVRVPRRPGFWAEAARAPVLRFFDGAVSNPLSGQRRKARVRVLPERASQWCGR